MRSKVIEGGSRMSGLSTTGLARAALRGRVPACRAPGSRGTRCLPVTNGYAHRADHFLPTAFRARRAATGCDPVTSGGVSRRSGAGRGDPYVGGSGTRVGPGTGCREGAIMPARIRDAIAVGVLVAAGFVALLAWHPLGRWVALGIALAGLLAAAVVYRLRPSAFPLFGTREVLDESDGAASTPRPAAAPPGPSSTGSRSRS